MKSILSILSITVVTLCFGQSPYIFSTYTEDYMEIQDGTPIDVFDYTATTWDDPEFTVPLFNFDILGQAYSSTTQVGVGSLMGFLDNNSNVIHGFGLDIDIMDGAALEGNSGSEISYVSNITPEFTNTIIQFSNVAFYDEIDSQEPSTSNRMSFQIQFHTPSNAMSIHFGPSNIPNPELVFYGLSGPAFIFGVDVEDQTGNVTYGAQLTGDPNDPTLIETFNSEMTEGISLGSMPQSGTVYRFEPISNGIGENERPLFSVYPTLTSDFIKVAGEIEPNSTFRIFDLTGKEIKVGQVNIQKSIDVSSIEAGLYLFSIDGMKSAVKFIKQ